MKAGTAALMIVTAFAILAAVVFAGCTTTQKITGSTPPPDPAIADWRLIINGTAGKILTLQDLRQLPAVSGYGYAVSTTGIRFGPYACRGVDLRDLVTLAGGMAPEDQIWISAPDGYLWVFDADQLQGHGFVTFDTNLKEMPSPPLRIILMYEQDGAPVSYDDGGPARIAIISEEPGVITEGSSWVKWVDSIEIKKK